MIVNNTSPNITVGTSKLGNANFVISLKEISEKTPQNSVVQSYALKDINFTLDTREDGKNKFYNYSALLNNGALVVVLVS